MARVLALLLGVFLLGGVFVLPRLDPARLVALEAGELLDLELPGEPGAREELQPLWRAILASDAARADSTGASPRVTLALAAVDVEVAGAPGPSVALEARHALVRALRQRASNEGIELAIEGENEPVPGGADLRLRWSEGRRSLAVAAPGAAPLAVAGPWTPPARTSLLPPLVAVALAILLRRPLIALFAGVLVGSVLVRLREGAGAAVAAGAGFADVFRGYFWSELTDPERAMIIGFVVFMLAMVGVMTRAGGIRGLMDAVSRLASSVRRSQVATYLMGLAVFFDDYANTILVGTTMRPLTDRFRVAREKLAYIVDSTSAPVAGLSVFSTWIAFEVSTFSAQLPAAGLTSGDGYAVFLETLPYRFYCVFTLLFVALVVATGRDFGPMLAAERRARRTGALVRPGGKPMVAESATAMEPAPGVAPRAWRAVLPLVAFVAGTLLAIAWAGGAFAGDPARFATLEGVTQVLYDGSGSRPLLLGSGLGLALAVAAALLAGLRSDVLRAAWTTLRAMGIAFAILYLAWMIGAVCADLGTAPYLTALVGDAIDARLLPSILFLLAGGIAFATGSSWSTMSILLPLVVGLAYGLGLSAGLADTPAASGHLLMVMSIGAVLEGSIFGDHCSPISDTTVMSSIASASDHIDHVRTQIPYAAVTMAVAMLAGYLPCTYLGAPPGTQILVGLAALAALVLLVGRRAEPAPERVTA